MANKNSEREDIKVLVGMQNLRLSLVLSAAVLLLGACSGSSNTSAANQL